MKCCSPRSIRNHVRLVSLQQDVWKLPSHNAPDTLAGDLAKQLGQWTGKDGWSRFDKEGPKHWPKMPPKRLQKPHDAIAMDPLITKIMEVFPAPRLTPSHLPNPETDHKTPMTLSVSMMRRCQDDAQYGRHDEEGARYANAARNLQAELDSQHFSASAGNGYVTATVTGSGPCTPSKLTQRD